MASSWSNELIQFECSVCGSSGLTHCNRSVHYLDVCSKQSRFVTRCGKQRAQQNTETVQYIGSSSKALFSKHISM